VELNITAPTCTCFELSFVKMQTYNPTGMTEIKFKRLFRGCQTFISFVAFKKKEH